MRQPGPFLRSSVVQSSNWITQSPDQRSVEQTSPEPVVSYSAAGLVVTFGFATHRERCLAAHPTTRSPIFPFI